VFPDQLEQPGPARGARQDKLADILVLPDAASRSRQEQQHEIEVEEMDQAEVPESIHHNCLEDVSPQSHSCDYLSAWGANGN